MVIAVSLEHDIIDDVETLTPSQVSAYTRAILQRYRTARGGASAEEYGSAVIAQQLRRLPVTAKILTRTPLTSSTSTSLLTSL